MARAYRVTTSCGLPEGVWEPAFYTDHLLAVNRCVRHERQRPGRLEFTKRGEQSNPSSDV